MVENFKGAVAHGKLQLVSVEASTLLRLSMSPLTEPYFGKRNAARWDDPQRQFGVAYAAMSLEVAFSETVVSQALF